MSYSQGREENIILRMVADLQGERTVLDIGAGNGRDLSNSLALIERGWSGVLVEPSPFAFQKLMALHCGNPKVTLLNAAIGVENRITKFYEADDSLYSTTIESHAKLWETRGIKHREYYVAQVTLQRMIEQLGGGADVLSIDAEGASVDILMSVPFGSWNPHVVIVEHDSRVIEISGWMAAKNYECGGLTAENAIFVKVPK